MPRSCLGPLEDHSSPRGSSLPLFACACICSWTLAILDVITWNSMLRSHRMIIQTLDDVTAVISVTLMCLLRNAAQQLCCAAQAAACNDRPPSSIRRHSRAPVPRITGSALLTRRSQSDRTYATSFSTRHLCDRPPTQRIVHKTEDMMH